jgi:hypothetical protein
MSDSLMESHGLPPSVEDCISLEDPDRDLFPFSVVWAPIPVVSWVVPFLGHVGICDSQGRVWDFQKSQTIIVCRFCCLSLIFVFSPLRDILFSKIDRMSSGRPQKFDSLFFSHIFFYILVSC